MSIRETAVQGFFGVRTRSMRCQIERYVDVIHHISNYDRDQMHLRVPCKIVVPNWVDFQYFDCNIVGQPLRNELGIAHGKKVVLTLGGATRIKGTQTVLEAAKLLQGRPDIVILVVGIDLARLEPEGNLKKSVKAALGLGNSQALRDYFRENNLHLNVKTLGHRTDIPSIMAASDMVVFAASRPHQARPAFEAGAMKKPIVSSRFECLAETVQDGKNGLYFEAGNARALAQCILSLVDDPRAAEQMGINNYSNALVHHEQKKNAERLVSVYDQSFTLSE